MDENEISTIVRLTRKSKGLSRYMVGKCGGLRPSIVKSIENGDKAYTIRSLMKVLEVLELEITISDGQ